MEVHTGFQNSIEPWTVKLRLLVDRLYCAKESNCTFAASVSARELRRGSNQIPKSGMAVYRRQELTFLHLEKCRSSSLAESNALSWLQLVLLWSRDDQRRHLLMSSCG